MDSAPATTPSPSPARKRLGLLQWIAVGVLVVVVLGLAAYAVLLPQIVHSKVAAALNELGFPDAQFTVERTSLWGTTIHDVAAGGESVRIGSVVVTYSPLEVIHGRLERVAIEDAEIHVAVNDGQVGIPGRAAATEKSGAAAPDLPFAELTFDRSAITVEWRGQSYRNAMTGTVTRTADREIAVKLGLLSETANIALPQGGKLRAPQSVLHVDARLDPRGDWKADVRASTESDLIVQSIQLDLKAAHVALTATLAGRLGDESAPLPTVEAELSIKDAAVRHEASKLSALGITANVPFSMGAQSRREPGDFKIAQIALGDEGLGAASGTIALAGARADFALQWAALPDAVLSANGWLGRDEAGGIDGEIAADLRPFQLSDATTLAARVPALKGWRITGERLGGEAKVKIDDGKAKGRVTVSADNADAANQEMAAEIKGLSGTIALDITDGQTSTPVQRITATRAAFEKIELTDLSLAFALEKPDALFIEQLSAGWLGGRVSTAKVRFNPADPKFKATLVADKLSLRQLLELTAQGRARGEGVMSGPVMLRVSGSDVSFVGGYLRSESQTGELQVLDTKWLGETMDKSDPRFTTERELRVVKDRILTALSDFSYDRLTFSFGDEPESRGRMSVSTHGTGRTEAGAQELDFTLNFRGVNDVLRHGLSASELWNKLTNPKIGR